MTRVIRSSSANVLEQAAIGTATLVVALLGYLLVPQLDDTLIAAMATIVALLLGLGTYLLARGHPSFGALGRAHTWTAWVPSVAWFAAGAAALRLARLPDSLVPAVGATLVLAAILFAQHRELQLGAGNRRAAEFLVSLTVFVSAFTLFGVLYDAHGTGGLSVLATGGLAALLASVPLRRAVAEDGRTALYCLVVGAVVGQAAWALTYWTAAAIVGGALLLLLFYVTVGLGETMLDRSFTRRVLLEYTVVGSCGIVLIAGMGPWHG